jgi:Xaa-Pro dipeptidase
LHSSLDALGFLSLTPRRGWHGPAVRVGEEQALYDTDRELLFRQESYFQWAFGVAEPGFFGVMDVSRRRSVMFMPRLPPEYAVWMGAIHSPQYFRRKYEVDEVLFADQLDEFLSKADPAVLYTLKGLNSDSGNTASEARFDGVDKYRVDNGRLFPIIANLRVRGLAGISARARSNVWTLHTC